MVVTDADPQPMNGETSTLLVDWPVDAAAPRCCAFVAAESRCPPALAALLDRERAARAREELNGLYVAMTRAEERLVFSFTEPTRHGDAPSWWQRVQLFVAPLDVPAAAMAASDAAPTLRRLPAWQPAAQAAPLPDADALEARLGRAVHRVLEWATGPAHGKADADAAQRAAAEFGLPAAHAATVARCSAAILGSAQCAPFFDAAALLWAGNEVDLADADGALRIDRLVARAGATGTEWWALDYKLAHQPQADERLRAQLARYRSAVQALQPHDTVRAAFVSGIGELIELL